MIVPTLSSLIACLHFQGSASLSGRVSKQLWLSPLHKREQGDTGFIQIIHWVSWLWWGAERESVPGFWAHVLPTMPHQPWSALLPCACLTDGHSLPPNHHFGGTKCTHNQGILQSTSWSRGWRLAGETHRGDNGGGFPRVPSCPSIHKNPHDICTPNKTSRKVPDNTKWAGSRSRAAWGRGWGVTIKGHFWGDSCSVPRLWG